jgi:hypothetical protein
LAAWVGLIQTQRRRGALIEVRFLPLTDVSRARSWCRRRDYPMEG